MVCTPSVFSKVYAVMTCVCSLHQFLEQPVSHYIDGQLTKMNTMADQGSFYARVFVACFPVDNHFLTQHQFWISVLTMWRSLSQRSDIDSKDVANVISDTLVSWKLNFFRSHLCWLCTTQQHELSQPFPSCFNTHHTVAVTVFSFLVGDPQRYNTLLSSRRVTLNQGNRTYIFRCGLTIQNHLDQALPHTFKRHRLTPIASLKPAFVPFSTWVLDHFISKKTSQTILKNPYLFFRTKPNDYTMSSNGDSVRITFSPHPKATRVKLSGEALADK
ncbi:hypothetical protein P9112_002764 [Eukaryota sp. TZLM1-RC]